MKKNLHFLFVAVMAMVGNFAFADEITFSPSEFEAVTNGDYSMTKNGVTMAVTASTVTSEQFRIFKSQTITFTSTTDDITQVVFICTEDNDTKYGPGCFGDITDGTYSYEGTVGTWKGGSREFSLTAKTNQVRATSIVVTVGSSAPSTKTATAIEFSGAYETRATCGKDESVSLPTAVVKANNAVVEGASVTWESSSPDIAAVSGSKLTIANGTQGTVTIKASYAGNDTYEASSKTYKLTVYKGALLLSSLVEDVTSSNEKWDKGGEYVSYWFVDIDNGFASVPNTVTYANEKYVYLTDGTNNLLFYGNNTLGLKQGDVISGDLGDGKMGAIWGKLYRYNKLPELSFTEMDVKVQSEGAKVEPKTITADKINENLNAYVKIEGAQFVSVDNRNLTFKVGDQNLAVYNQFGVSVDALEENAVYTLFGMGSVYNTTYQLNPITFQKTADPAGIADVNVDQQAGPVYNVAGQLLAAPQKGINIIGGRKVFVK